MEERNKGLSELSTLKLPKQLRGNILLQIRREECRRARKYLFTSVAAVPLSALGVVFSLQYMMQGFYQSSFYSYFSLLLSDPDVVFSSWREFALSIAESVPFAGITVSLITIGILLLSIRIFANNLRNGLTDSFSNT